MKQTIKLSEDAVRAIEIQKKVEALVEEYKGIFDGIDDDVEKNLLGGLVILIYSPVAEVGISSRIGSTIITNGMVKNLVDDEKKGEGIPSFADLLEGLKS